MKVQGNSDGLELNETQQLHTYADDVNILGENRSTTKKTHKGLIRRLV
jgi:hypothetical protein